MNRKKFLQLLALGTAFPLSTRAATPVTAATGKTILEYGAKGDGKSDDTEAFERAFRNQNEIILPSDKVFILDGLILEGKAIKGPGKISKKPGASSCLILKGDGNTVTDVTFVSKGAGKRPETEILLHSGASTSLIKNCKFEGYGFTCISSGVNTDKDKILKSEISRKGIMISQNHFSGQYVHHLYLHVAEVVSISENFFEKSQFDSIRLRQLVKTCTISGNFFSEIGLSKVPDSRDAVDCFWSGNELVISNNHFNGAAVHALDIKGHSPDLSYGTSRVQITGNQIRNSGHSGILISAGAKTEKGWKSIKHIQIMNNIIEQCGFDTNNPNDAAILMRHGQKNVQIHSNQIFQNKNKGIMVGNFQPGADISRNISIQGNLILNNGRKDQKESYGIHVSGGENVLIAQNIIENRKEEENPFQTSGIVIENYRNYKLKNIKSLNNIVEGHLIKDEVI